MGRLCTVCTHPKRAEIDLALARHTASYRGIAKRFGLDDVSLFRHEHNHLRTNFQRVQEEKGMDIAEYVLHEMRDLNERTGRAMDRCEQLGDDRGVFAGAEIGGRNLHRLWEMGADAPQRLTRERIAAQQHQFMDELRRDMQAADAQMRQLDPATARRRLAQEAADDAAHEAAYNALTPEQRAAYDAACDAAWNSGGQVPMPALLPDHAQEKRADDTAEQKEATSDE